MKTVPNEYCTGCGFCAVVCPKKCISMIENKEGFLYPSIDMLSCVKCGKCLFMCPLNNLNNKEEVTRAFAVQAKDKELLELSSSGAVFSLLAECILNQVGIVIGAAFNENNEVEHICIDAKEDLYKLRGSKYVQSDITKVYIPIKNALESGKKVMFVGTPCQTAAIYKWGGMYL